MYKQDTSLLKRKNLILLLPVIILMLYVYSCNDDSSVANNECNSDNPNDYTEVSGTQLLMSMDYETEATFFNFPFPNNVRRDDDGTISMTGYPGETKMIASTVVDIADEQLTDFGLYSAIYLTFNGPVDETTLPQTVAETVGENPSVFLINLDTGKKAPVSIKYWDTASIYNPANMISVSPYFGFPLEQASNYALIITRDVKDINGVSLGSPVLFEQAKCNAVPVDYEAVGLAYEPLANYLAGENSIAVSDVAAATVFTTQDTMSDMEALRTAVRNITPSDATNWGFVADDDYSVVYKGKIIIPIYQSGDAPYSSEGGEIIFTNGVPQQVTTETVDFYISIPETSMPSSGWPVVIYQHGTGGDYSSFYGEDINDLLGEKGIAVIGISQPLHNGRAGYGEGSLDLNVFNIMNPIAFRDNIRQSATEALFLVHAIQSGSLDVPDSTSVNPRNETLDPDNIMFMGHSQGSTTGPLAVAVEPDFTGAVFSGAGAGLRDTLLYKIKPAIDLLGMENIPDILSTIMLIPAEDMDEHHPLVNLLQLGGEKSDAINFARYFAYEADEDMAKDIMITCGVVDYYVPPIIGHAFAIASHANPVSNDFFPFSFAESWTEGAGPVDPEDPYPIAGLSILSPSVNNNLSNNDNVNRTVVFVEYEWRTGSDGHFVIFNNSEAQEQYPEFLGTLANDGTATLPVASAP